jgi:hypothetical protein
MLRETSHPNNFWSEIIAAEDPEPVRAPRYVPWPSICDTTRTNWLNPAAETSPPAPLPGTESFTIDVGCHLHAPPLAPGESLPEYLQNFETICTPTAAPAEQAAYAAHSYSHDAAPTPLPPDLCDSVYTTAIAGVGLPPPAAPKRRKRPDPDPEKPRKKLGRPAIFDEIMRARFCAMVQSGCTRRYAARRLGVSHATVNYACSNDPQFADRLRRAEQERDLTAVGRIHNAGEKSWRAAAWLLERNVPEHFSFRNQNRDPATRLLKLLGKRRFKQLLAEAAQQAGGTREPPPPKSNSKLPQPKPRQPTLDVIEAQINELLQTLPANDRFHVMDRLGY